MRSSPLLRKIGPAVKRSRSGHYASLRQTWLYRLQAFTGVAEDFVVWLSAPFVLAVSEPIHLVEQEVVEAGSVFVLAGVLVLAKRFGIDAPHVARDRGARAIEEHHPVADVALPDFG